MSIDWSHVTRRRLHRQLGSRPRWFNGAPVQSMAVDPRGRYVLTGGSRFLRLFWAESGELVRTLEGPGNDGSIYERIGFTPDGTRVLGHIGTARVPGALGVWEVETGALLKRIGSGRVGRVSAIDPWRERALVRGPGAEAALVDVEAETVESLAPRPDGGLGAAAFLANGHVAAASSASKTVHAWNAEDGAPVWTAELRGPVLAMAAPADPKASWLACTGPRNGVELCEIASGHLVRVLEDPEAHATARDGVLQMQLSRDGARLLAASASAALVWDVATGARLVRRPVAGRVAAALAPDARWLVLAGEDAQIQRIAIDGAAFGEPAAPGPSEHAADVVEVRFEGTRNVVSRDRAGRAIAWDLETGAPSRGIGEVPGPPVEPDWVRALRPAIDRVILDELEGGALESLVFGRDLALARPSFGDVMVWSRSSPDRPVRVFDTGSTPGGLTHGRATCVALHPNGRVAAIGTTREDAPLQLWDATTGTPIAVLEGHEAPPLALAFRSDGAQLASGSADRTVRLWPLDDL